MNYSVFVVDLNLAICKEGCPKNRGFCEQPGECRFNLLCFFVIWLEKNDKNCMI